MIVIKKINDTPRPFALIDTNGRFGDEIIAACLIEDHARLFLSALSHRPTLWQRIKRASVSYRGGVA